MSNPNYGVNGYTAFAIEQRLKRSWTSQITAALPLLACIHDSGLKWNKGFELKGTKILVPLMTTLVTGMTTGTAGVTDANEIPAAWPTYDATQGFTHAAYELTHLRRPMTIKESEKVVAGGRDGARGNLIDGKVTQLMATFKSVIADFLAGTTADARDTLMGLGYMVATNNVVGGIDQATYAYWRAGLNAAVGTFSLPIVNNAYDTISRYADETGETAAPDLLLLSFNGAGVNVYGRMRELIAPAERIVNAAFKAKYGINNFQYLDMKCVLDNRGAAGTAKMLSTSTFYYGGNEKPKQGAVQRIQGSDAEEWMFTQWCALACDEIRRNYGFAGITG